MELAWGRFIVDVGGGGGKKLGVEVSSVHRRLLLTNTAQHFTTTHSKPPPFLASTVYKTRLDTGSFIAAKHVQGMFKLGQRSVHMYPVRTVCIEGRGRYCSFRGTTRR